MPPISEIDRFSSNRPDALGIFEDSRVKEDPRSPYSETRYTAAMRRLVDKLLVRSDIAQGKLARGKRRLKIRPQDKSNTLRTYLKALELFSYYCTARYGVELEPRNVTLDIANEFALWMAGKAPGPDVRAMYARALGPEYLTVYEAVSRACARYGQVGITEVLEELPLSERASLITIPLDSRDPIDVRPLHRRLGRLIRAFHTIIRSPTSKEIRAQEGEIWTKKEQDPYTYRYAIVPRVAMATGSVVTHLSALSAVWSEMARPASPDEPPMAFNPWKSLYADWRWTLEREHENARARGENRCMTTPLAMAMQNACIGTKLENRRDMLAITLLLYLGLRAEELAGLLRSDLRDQAGNLTVNVLGKGNKVRNLPLGAIERDALTLLTGKLEEEALETNLDDEGRRVPTYRARYCRALLSPDAPLVPSLVKWGCFLNDGKRGTDPEKDARECLDTSGVRALVEKIAERARVKVIATDEIRGFTEAERTRVHPHAFRHYAATAARESGLDLTEIKLMLGHESVSTTENYIAVPAQLSMAFSAAVYQQLHRRGPLTQEDLLKARRTSLSPLEDPTIIEWHPDVKTPTALRITPLSPPARQATYAAPVWAYDHNEELSAYLPLGVTARKFSVDVKRREAEVTVGLEHARSINDAQGYAMAVQQLAEVRARHLWVTFRVGRLSRLPWWAGRANRWKDKQLAPIASFAQVAAENSADGALIHDVRQLYDEFYEQRGPTAAAALVAWLGELLDVAGRQFARAMTDRKDTWIPFEGEAPAGAPVVREHMPEAIVQWLREYGGAVYATGYKSAKNRGNIAIAAMDSLPDWFWVPDPLADPKLGLPRSERADLRNWITGLQATRPSALRYDEWLEQMSVRVMGWARRAKVYKDRTGQDFTWLKDYTDRDAFDLAAEALSIASDLGDKYPGEIAKADVPAIVRSIGDVPNEAQIKNALQALLDSVKADPTRARIEPTIRLRAGAAHMFDPSLLTFNDNDTIVHSPDVKKWWYERHGSDSECVVRRALRTLWERRKGSARSQAHGLIARHFDLELSSLIPCAAEIENRIRQMGWTPPRTPEDVVRVSKIMWAGLGDQMRVQQGADPVERVPKPAVEMFWSEEIPEIARMVEEHAPDVISVTDSTESGERAIDQLDQQTQSLPQQYVEPSPAPAPRPLRDLSDLDEQGWEELAEQLAPPEQETAADTTVEADDGFGADVAITRAQKAAKRTQRLADRERLGQELADALAASAVRQEYGYALDADLLWKVIDTAPTTWLVLSTMPGEAAVLTFQFLRRVRKALKPLKPTVTWDNVARVLRFRWERGQPKHRGGLNLFTSPALPQDESFTAVSLFSEGDITPNASPRWTDPRPWAAYWPNYPQPDTADVQHPDVLQIPWPKDPVRNGLDAARYHACMLRYERWKRNGLRIGMIPPGWQPGVRKEAPRRQALPHPVDFAFAVVRPA